MGGRAHAHTRTRARARLWPSALAQTLVSLFFLLSHLLILSHSRRVQNLQNLRWEEAEVNSRLDKKMSDAFASVWAIHTERRIPLRTAAFVQALQRVTRAHIHRGFD
jgi:hypothetical protein